MSPAKQQAWSWWEHDLLRRAYALLPIETLAAALGRSEMGVRSRAKMIGVSKGLRRWWTAREDALLRALYADTPTEKIARRLGRDGLAVYRRAWRLGLKKSDEFMRRCRAECGAELQRRWGLSGRFPKGLVPHNKGKRMPGYAPGRMAETQFKKGYVPQNWLPVGTVMFNPDGYLVRKVSDLPKDGTPAFRRNWEFVHRRVWEDAHGPIPPGHRIWWKDGNHANCALDNLELLNGAEHMARTTVHTLPPELKQVIMLTGALQRKIRNRKEKGKLDGEKQNRGPARPPVRDPGVAERLRA